VTSFKKALWGLAVTLPVLAQAAPSAAPAVSKSAIVFQESGPAPFSLEDTNLDLIVTDIQKKSQDPNSFVAKMKKKAVEKWAEVNTKLQEQSKRLKIRYKLGINGEDLIGLGSFTFTGTAYGEVMIEPNFRDGEQVRRDVWVFGLGGQFPHLGAHANIRFTKSRVFKGPKAKSDAMAQALPEWFLNEIPRNTAEMKKYLKNEETLRIEVLGDIGTWSGIGDLEGKSKSGILPKAQQDALFLVDLYRHSDSIFRLRTLGLKSRGSLGTYGTLGFEGFFGGAIRKATGLYVKIGGSRSVNPWAELPIDTGMVDYLFNLNAAPGADGRTAAAGMDELAEAAWKLKFLPLFIPLRNSEKVFEQMMSSIPLVKQLAQADLGRKINDRRVRALFRGHMNSKAYNLEASSNVLVFGNSLGQIGGLSSNVTSYDEAEKPSYYHLENAFSRAKFSLGVGSFWADDTVTDFDMIHSALNEKFDLGPMVDLIVRYESRENVWDSGEINGVRSKIENSLSSAAIEELKLHQFFPTSKQTNASVNFQFAYGSKAMKSLAGLSEQDFIQAFEQYFRTHAEQSKFYLEPDDSHNAGELATYNNAIHDIGSELYYAFSPNVPPARQVKAFGRLKEFYVFREWILPQMLPRMLPVDQDKEIMNLQASFTSEQNPVTRHLGEQDEKKDKDDACAAAHGYGKHKISAVYQPISLLRAVLNDRSYDMHLETIKDGADEILVTPAYKSHLGNCAR
jgi:hypothetical protein